MIKIENPKLNDIAEKYSKKIKTKCSERAKYLKKNLQVIFNGVNHVELEQYALNGNSKKSISNSLLVPNKKLKNQEDYHNLTLENCHNSIATYQVALERMTEYLIDEANLKALILCSPENAICIENCIKRYIDVDDDGYTTISPIINKVIDYSLFDTFAYDISKELGYNTCPYCNRISIHTVIDKKKKGIIRPTFDHFFSQINHPLLALSFYNLIPSCYYCNSNLKGKKEMALDTHLHPYLEGFGNDIKFHIKIKDINPDKSHPDNYDLFLKPELDDSHPKYHKTFFQKPSKTAEYRGNINLFRLEEIYNVHKDTVGELIVKCDSLSMGYADSLNVFFPQLKTNKSEFYRFYFGNYFNEKDFHKRPLAKMSKDIISKTLPYFW